MRAGGGKEKGSEFERYCCKRLSLWATKGLRDDVFWRSAMSGGRATLQLKQDIINKAQSGDITAISPEGYELCERCLFENKFYANLQIPQGLLKGTGLLSNFWADTVKAAASFGKAPVLIAKQNLLPPFVLCPIGFDLFSDPPIIRLHHWETDVYLFEDATKVIRKRYVR